ncbi:MAG: putative bifunctional diguanylate cyclase/phosphodiesterase [Pseudomonadota bacterium]
MNVLDSLKQAHGVATPPTTLNGPTPFDENARLAELRSLDILDTPPDKYFDRFTQLIAKFFKVPMVAVAFIDKDRQWFKSTVGIKVSEMPRENSFCIHALQQDLLEVPDALDDDFFKNHRLVAGSPFVRFYMGTVLRGPTGQPLGTLHIMDIESRYLSREKRAWLVTFGHLAQELINHNHHDLSISDQLDQQGSHRGSITGLPGVVLFGITLKHLIRQSEEKNGYLAILYLRLNSLDEITKIQGRSTRDIVLCCLADRLIADDTGVLAASHLTDNTFGAVIKVPGVYNLFETVTPIANKVSGAIELEGIAIRPDIDIGISLSPLDGRTPQDLLERARTALNGSRSHAGLYVFSHEAEETALRRYKISQHLESALQHNQLINKYQPLVTVDGSRIVGFEALARWHDPEMGEVSPADFVPIAEQNTRLSRMLTEWSVATVCGEVPRWPFRPEDAPFRVAINVPPNQFLEQGFVDYVLDRLKEHGMAPESLTLEITEEAILVDIDAVIQTMREFRNHNIAIALDDFGTGYSSLSKLKDLPIDILKIDKSFIDNLTHDTRVVNLVGGIIRIAHGFGLKVVAEGVEYEAQRARLQGLGCDIIQGYLFSRPLLPEGAIALLRSRTQAG